MDSFSAVSKPSNRLKHLSNQHQAVSAFAADAKSLPSQIVVLVQRRQADDARVALARERHAGMDLQEAARLRPLNAPATSWKKMS
jgi:hypothetical protein